MAKALGKAQKSVLCRLNHRPLKAHGSVAATLRGLRKKRLAKLSFKAKGHGTFISLTKLGRKRAAQVCN